MNRDGSSKVVALEGRHGTADSASVSVHPSESKNPKVIALQLKSEWRINVPPIESQTLEFDPASARRLATALQKAADLAERAK